MLRCFQVYVQQLLVRSLIHAAERRGEKSRGIVDEHVQARECRCYRGGHLLYGASVAKIRLEQLHAAGAYGVQLVAQSPGIVQGTQVVQGNVHALGVQTAHDLRTNSAPAAGYHGNSGWRRIGKMEH